MVRDSRKIAAILSADVVDYSRLMGADEQGTLAALKARRAIFDEQVREFDGHEFGSVGDSLMAEFASAVNAVQCALAIQERVEAGNAALPAARRMQLRIGVNLGDVIEERGSAFGDAVNIAARLQSLAKPGGVLISGAVYEQVHLRIPARFIDAGKREVRNVAEPVRTFVVLPPEPPGIAGRITQAVRRATSRRVRRAVAVIAILSVSVLLGQFWREIPVPGTARRLGALLHPEVPAPALNSIAVLPFVNMSGNAGDDYLGDGLAEELSNRLARSPDLHVAARTSTFAFKGKQLDIAEIAARLGVSYVIEGSVRRDAGRVRVNAALVEVADGTQRWSNSYESPSGDFFTIEGEIGAQLMTALETLLGTRGAPAVQLPSGIGSAYDYFLQGRAYLRQKKSGKSLDAAEQLFERALAEQPDFARALAGLCETRVERFSLERVPALVAAAEDACGRAQALDSRAQEVHEAIGRLRLATGDAAEAETAYRQALALVPQSPDVLIGLGNALTEESKFDEAEATYRRAIAAQPQYAAAHIAFGNYLIRRGRPADAIAPFERATLLEPDNPSAFNNLGGAQLQDGDFERATEAFSRSLAIEPRQSSYSNIGTVLYYRGRYGEAVEMYRKATELAPADHFMLGNLADALRFDGQVAESLQAYRRALELVDGELAVNPKHAFNHAQAAYYATLLGDKDRARRSIPLALQEAEDFNYVHYYVALAYLGLGDQAKALMHARRARDLGYPEALLRAAPELGDIRSKI